MIRIVDWAADHARMVLTFIVITLVIGWTTYTSLPKEGEPDIEIPALFISVPFPGISASDSEKLLVQPMETELSDLDGLDKMTSTASEGYAGVALLFEFGWDKSKIMADVRDRMTRVQPNFPSGAENYSMNEINFSEFPILIVNLTGDLPERTMLKIGKELQDVIEGLEPVLSADLAGHRDEMLEVLIDPLRLEAYNVTAGELINVVRQNNQLIAAGEIKNATGSMAIKIPSSFDEATDVYNLPVKRNGDRIVTLGDLAEIRLTFEDHSGVARFNGETTLALQVVKRKGYNIIDTSAIVQEALAKEQESWPPELKAAIKVGTSNDQSTIVASMVSQLEGSVLTAIALVMIVVLAALGTRAALLVGFAIPSSFLLCFIFLSAMGVTISNIVMFGLILAVGMLVDGAIVVVEYADRRIEEGAGPMHAFVEAAKRMFWPIVSSTATTLCAFLPMLFWPGVPGQFMGMLPVTLIFVLSASLIVALIYLPVMGGVSGRISRLLSSQAEMIAHWPKLTRVLLIIPTGMIMFTGLMKMLNPSYIFGEFGGVFLGGILFMIGSFSSSIALQSANIEGLMRRKKVEAGYQPTAFGIFIRFLVSRPYMPFISIFAVLGFVALTFITYGANNNGTEFFVESEPEQAIIYVKDRGNLSLEDKDRAVAMVEKIVLDTPGIDSAFAFAGSGGLNNNTGGAEAPRDSIGRVQIELIKWEKRKDQAELDGDVVLADLEKRLATIPGIQIEILNLSRGPASAKPVHLRVTGDNWDDLTKAAEQVRAKFDQTEGLTQIEDTLPLPGIDWQFNVDVEKAGRYGADVATVGGMIQLVTRGILLDTMRVDSSDEEIDIRVRMPEEYRVLSTLDTLKLRTADGLIPLSNFVTRIPVKKLGQIDRYNQSRYFDIKAGIVPDMVDADGKPVTPDVQIANLTSWLEDESPLPTGIKWEWTGDQEDQAESQAFLGSAFLGALALMFIILLAQFNSFYNSILVLLAVVLSTAGVLLGMLLMGQSFSIIMTGTGIVALAGIVVNNNIVLIDTYQEFSAYMPRIEAIVRTAEARIRPVLLTTVTTMAGLAPMMLGISLDFVNGGYSINSPTALWWIQLATAVVFGLGIATVLTLVFTPSMLALRVWASTYAGVIRRYANARRLGRDSRAFQDIMLDKRSQQDASTEVIWDPSEIVMGSETARKKK
ncbi:MAG: efflux RND transporter permease subunit [Halocynthiibacter sp.]